MHQRDVNLGSYSMSWDRGLANQTQQFSFGAQTNKIPKSLFEFEICQCFEEIIRLQISSSLQMKVKVTLLIPGPFLLALYEMNNYICECNTYVQPVAASGKLNSSARPSTSPCSECLPTSPSTPRPSRWGAWTSTCSRFWRENSNFAPRLSARRRGRRSSTGLGLERSGA